MRSINKVQLLGNLVKDADIRAVGEAEVTNFRIATNRKYKGSDGEMKTDSQFHNVVHWNPSSYLKDALKKGALVLVEGRLEHRSYDDKDGVKRYVTEVIAFQVDIIPIARNGNGNGNGKSAAPEPEPSAEEPVEEPAEDPVNELPF